MSYRGDIKPADIRKRVIRGQDTKYEPATLAVNEVDGEMWATNRYWGTRATRVAPLLAEYNLPADQPGLYGVNGRVSRTDKQVPDISGSMRAVFEDYTTPGTRVRIAGR